MKKIPQYTTYIITLIIQLVVSVSCSTNKNTAETRWWHAFNAKYNTYYNGAQAYIDGSLEKENGNKDNYTEMIPLYTIGNKASISLGKANFDRAIEKGEKAIAQHSIKRRPEWTKNRKKTAEDMEWLSRKEYNPFLWKAWMLIGRSQFYQGKLNEAASTFAYMSRLYKGQPAIYGKARAWLAKCFIESGANYDAEDVIKNIQRDTLDWRAVKEWDYTYADYYLHTQQWDKATSYLEKVIKHEMRRKQKARELFLLGQVYAAMGKNAQAFEAYKRVIRANPPHELEFNARIAQTEVTDQAQSHQMVQKLKRMAASDNNKDYLDQVYYAMGNIYLAQKDTIAAINAYEEGNKKATRNGIEKGVLLLHLGNLHWDKGHFSDAKRCYTTALGLLDKERKDYEELSNRSKVLDELVPYTDAIQLQDSLQYLARCSEEERNAAIDRVINVLKKKEKEERDREAGQNGQVQNGLGSENQIPNNPSTQKNQSLSTWYFYNPTTMAQGKTIFEQQWGKRENIDNWQRINQTNVAGIKTTNGDTAEGIDSTLSKPTNEDKKSKDSIQNDPHKREFYLAQIPFTKEQLDASNKILMDGLFHAGVIFKDRLDNLDLAEKELRRLSDSYPNYAQMDDNYYHLYLLYMRKHQPAVANEYITKLKNKYPKSKWTVLLTDPNYITNAKFGVQIEDSLYASTYDAFKAGRYQEVEANSKVSEQRFPLGANRDKFLFIGGLGKLNSGDASGCLQDMKTVVEKYPKSRISELAGMIINGVKTGRKLHGGKFDMGDVWAYREQVLTNKDSASIQKFSTDRDVPFKVQLIYNPDKVDENKLLFELARFNFGNFYVRNFDITKVDLGSLHAMELSGFNRYDEAYQYIHQLLQNKDVVSRMGKDSKYVIISEKNLQLIGTSYSYKDYGKFYNEHFTTLKIAQRYLLSEPEEVTNPRERDEDKAPSKPSTKEKPSLDENLFPMETPKKEEENGTTTAESDRTTIPLDTKKAVNGSSGIEIPMDKPTPKVENKSEVPNNTMDIPFAPSKEEAKQQPSSTKGAPANNGKATPQKSGLSKENGKEKPATTKLLPAEPQQPTTIKKKKMEDDGPVIYFGDDPTSLKNKDSKKKNNQKIPSIEDEYYDLDGF